MGTPVYSTNTTRLHAGFTFIETLVAISILLLAVAGPLYLAAQGLRAARIARDQIQANYIAQEAIEYIRFRRDGNVLAGNDWLSGELSTECMGGNLCTMDVYSGDIFQCAEKESCPLQFEEATGKYGYGSGIGQELVSGWVETKFTRRVSIEAISDSEIEVVTTVSWRDGVLNRTYVLRENLLNWQ